MMTQEKQPQEIFDIVYLHLMAQGKPSMSKDNKMCCYRGEDGTMCAAGVLIPDDIALDFEGSSWDSVYDYNGGAIGDYSDRAVDMVSCLQGVHDVSASRATTYKVSASEEWEETVVDKIDLEVYMKELNMGLLQVASDYGLTVPSKTA
jgi:hypothetical protein